MNPSLPVLPRGAALLRGAALAAAVALAACQTPDPTPSYSDITFAHLAPIKLDVADVDYVDSYVPPRAPPNVEHLFPVRPAVVARRWAGERILPVGVTRIARITLVDARVVETALDTGGGLEGAFTTDQSERYDATVELHIEIVNSLGNVEGQAKAVAHRARTVPEDITLNERDQVWFELTEAVMRELDTEITATITRYLAKYLR